MTDSFEVRMLITVRTGRYDSTYYEVEVRPIRMEDGKVRNITDRSYRPEPFADLVISARGKRGEDLEPYGWSTRYHEPFAVDLDRAEVMVKTLRKVKRGLDKIESTYGPCESFGAYISRVANVLGIHLFGWLMHQGPSGQYDDNEYRWADAKHMHGWVTMKIAEMNDVKQPA